MANKSQFGASPSGGGLTFGSPASAPSFGTSTPGFAAPAFGALGGTGFGAQAPNTALSGFGATPPSAFGIKPAPAFGATPAPGFGANPAPAFGAASTSTFGTTSMPTFGAATNPAFGAPTASSMPGFGTGLPTMTTSAPNFGAGNSFNFGTVAPGTGLAFGTPSSVAKPLSFATPTTAVRGAPPSYNFGTALSSAPPGSLGFSFGGGLNTTTTTSAFGLNPNPTGLFAKPATSLPGDLTKPPTATVGLGGIDSSNTSLLAGTSGGNAGGTATGQSAPLPKSNALPMELATTVDAFKENVKQRKQLSSDIARCSIRPLHKVQSDTDALLRDITELTAGLSSRRRTANGLRTCGANALPAAERAHRIAETPHGLDYESSDVVAWITDGVAEGEVRLRLLRRQLEAAQRQMDSSSRPVTDEELALGMRRIHESFVAVAGRLQAVHQLVESLKGQYLSLRRNILKDPTDVFAKKNGSLKNIENSSIDWLSRNSGKNSSFQTSAVVLDPLTALGISQGGRQQSTTGPNPFSHLGSPGFSGLPFGFSKTQANTTPGNTSWGMTSLQHGATFSGVASPFGTSLTGVTDPSFALQKPPAGNKRGKY